MADNSAELEKSLNLLQSAYKRLKENIHEIVVGQDEVIDFLLLSIFCKGHSLLIGVPGLAKTMLVKSLSRSLSLSFNRIQFTPDLMPSDITGTELIVEDKNTGKRNFEFVKGPVFANVILADEINRTPPKTQSALLEVMQEHQVTAAGKRYKLDEPFFVLATQNPIEQEGTYPLPEAQTDRFMFAVVMSYPKPQDELKIMNMKGVQIEEVIDSVMTREEIVAVQDVVTRIPVSDHILKYCLSIVLATRKTNEQFDLIKNWVQWGAGPRASQYLVQAAKAHAALKGRYYVSTDDVKAIALPVLRHRIMLNFAAVAEGIKTEDIVNSLIAEIPDKENALSSHPIISKILEPVS